MKRYTSQKVEHEGAWRHSKADLEPINHEFALIVLSGAEAADVRVVAELVEVIN